MSASAANRALRTGPVRYAPRQPVFVKIPYPCYPGRKKPDIALGQQLIAVGPRNLRTMHYDRVQDILRRCFGKKHQVITDFFPTRAWTRRQVETKMGGGKGRILDFMAVVKAGKAIVRMPNLVPFGEFDVPPANRVLTAVAQALPNKNAARSQYNRFPQFSLKVRQQQLTRMRHQDRVTVKRQNILSTYEPLLYADRYAKQQLNLERACQTEQLRTIDVRQVTRRRGLQTVDSHTSGSQGVETTVNRPAGGVVLPDWDQVISAAHTGRMFASFT